MNKKNNFKRDFYFLNFCYYKYFRIKKNLFIKNINNKPKNFKDNSFNRDKQINIIQKYHNISVYNGKKEAFFVNFNKFIKIFYFTFSYENKNLFSYPNYINLFKLLDLKKINFDFNFFIKDFIIEYSSIFDIQIVKVPKKYKLKFKKKFLFELKYVYNKKRLKYTLKLINNFVKNKQNLNLKFNLFWSFIEIFFDPRKSFLWKRKINIYNKAMKKFFKKNLS